MAECARVDVTVTAASTRVAVAGEVDYEAIGAIEHRLARERDQSDVTHLILDLAGTTFINSSGMRLLIEASRHAHHNGYELSIVRAPAPVQRALEIAGLEQHLPFVGS